MTLIPKSWKSVQPFPQKMASKPFCPFILIISKIFQVSAAFSTLTSQAFFMSKLNLDEIVSYVNEKGGLISCSYSLVVLMVINFKLKYDSKVERLQVMEEVLL